FGDAGRTVLLEEHQTGEELSVMAVTDGERVALLPAARDFKRAEDADRGPNTGGMGAHAPSDRLDAAAAGGVLRGGVRPTVSELGRRGVDYRGVLYGGLMRREAGFVVIEFNARFGDPETEAILPLVEGDVTRLLAGAAAGRLEPDVVRAGSG